jgi:hypothetical protein
VRDQRGAKPDSLRVYDIPDGKGVQHKIYTVAIDRGRLGEFYDVQGTDWQDPPLLNNPTQTVRIGRRNYGLYYEGDKLRQIAWREGNGV